MFVDLLYQWAVKTEEQFKINVIFVVIENPENTEIPNVIDLKSPQKH